MDHDDQPRMQRCALESPTNLRQVGLFVQWTIKTHFAYVPAMMQEARIMGRDSKYWNATKRRAYDALTSEAETLWQDMGTWHRRLETEPAQAPVLAEALRRMVERPGVGIVKAGFYVQVVLGDGGCVDRHNLRQAGLRETAFERIPASAEGLTAKLHTYIQTCAALGGRATRWNQGCPTLSVLRPQSCPTADPVSKLHVTCICHTED
jgi:hypothetical protein